MKNAQEFSAQWLAELRAKVSEAREFGLWSSDQAAEPSQEEMIQQLRGLVEAPDVTIAVPGFVVIDQPSQVYFPKK